MKAENLLILFIFVFAYTRAAKCEVTEDQVTFFLHNRNYGDGEAQLTFQNLDIVNTSKPIFFLIHGKGATRNSTWYYETTDAYLAAGDYNVVQVDYSGPAGQDEEGAVRDAEFVGQIIGKLISNLIQNYKLSPNDVTVIGHSLGGHVSGYTGKNVKNITGTAIAKIVGLDPANLENLTSISTDNKLYKEDAGLVVVIHTEGKEGGSFYQIGDIDFFPNGGQHPQPGCENQQAVCSHIRATEYFPESISNPEGFVSTACESYDKYEEGACANNKNITLGGDLKLENEGIYYLDTNAEKPYSKE